MIEDVSSSNLLFPVDKNNANIWEKFMWNEDNVFLLVVASVVIGILEHVSPISFNSQHFKTELWHMSHIICLRYDRYIHSMFFYTFLWVEELDCCTDTITKFPLDISRWKWTEKHKNKTKTHKRAWLRGIMLTKPMYHTSSPHCIEAFRPIWPRVTYSQNPKEVKY